MSNINKIKFEKFEIFLILVAYCCLGLNIIITNDAVISSISAFCGITYTILAGKGLPICYPIGLCGTLIYSYLTYKNSLWGNFLLNLIYYVPIQIIGFFKWNQNLKIDKYEIIKTKLSRKERVIMSVLLVISVIITLIILKHFNDAFPLFDSITTVFSIFGMYLTVKRALEQWYLWIVVDVFSLIMWLLLAMKDVKAYPIVFQWLVYLIIAVYYFIKWNKEINSITINQAESRQPL